MNMLQATRLMRKGFETSVLLYGPGVLLGVQRGYPKLGSEAFPGHLVVNNKIGAFMAEGGKVYACRFALQALTAKPRPRCCPVYGPSIHSTCSTSSSCIARRTPSSSTPGRSRARLNMSAGKVRAAAVQLSPVLWSRERHD